MGSLFHIREISTDCRAKGQGREPLVPVAVCQRKRAAFLNGYENHVERKAAEEN